MTILKTINRNGLIGEWLLDGSWNDSNDWTKNNGTPSNVTYANTDVGMQYKYGSFNGSSSVIDIPITRTAWANYTISFWVNPTSINSWLNNENTIFNWTVWVLWEPQVVLNANWATYNDQLWVTSSNGYFFSNTRFSTWKWYHVVVRYTSTTETAIYVNWVLDNSVAYWSWASSRNLRLGTYHTYGRWYNWLLQWVRVWNRAITQDEIYTLYLEWKKKLSWASYSWLMDWLVAYYDMKWDANDVVGGNNWTVTWATLTTNNLWLANNAYTFNGTTNYISMWNILDETWSNPYSISFWMKYSANQYHMIVGKQLTSGNFTWYMIWYDQWSWNIIFSNVSSPSNQLEIRLASANRDWNWHHWAFTYDWSKSPSWVKIYVDWVAQTTTTNVNSLTGSISNSANFNIWSRNSWNLPFAWDLCGVLKFNKVLSADEVKQLYQLTSTTPNIYPF